MSEHTETEIEASRIEAFVWAQDLSYDVSRIVFSSEAREMYVDAEQGIRIKHVALCGKLLELEKALLEKDLDDMPFTEATSQRKITENMQRQITEINDYLYVKAGVLPVAKVAEVVSIEAAVQGTQPADERLDQAS